MLKRDLWLQAVPSGRGRLCLACLAKRLGRPVVAEDFGDLGEYFELVRKARTVEDYLKLGHTETGARAMVEPEPPEALLDDRTRLRAKKTAASAPNPALINAYLRDAQPDAIYRLSDNGCDLLRIRPGGKAAAKDRRAESFRALHHLWRRWRGEANAVEAAARACIETQQKKAPTPAYVTLADGSLHHPLPSPDEVAAIEAAIQQRREHWIVTLGAPPFFDRLLRVFFERARHIIFASPDPPTAMRNFWEGGVPVKGRRKEDNVDRNRKITTAVLDRVDAGEKLADAIRAVAALPRLHLSPEAVWTIYYACYEEERAVRGLRVLLDSE